MSNDTLLREVDEELRRDRMRKLWRQGAPFIIGAAVGVVLLVAGYEGWNWYHQGNSARSSDQFYAAAAIADGTDFEAAKTALDGVIATGSGAYPALAQFREASLLAQAGRTDEAVAAYDSLSTSLSDGHLRELALVMAGNLLVDGGDVAAVENRVGGSIAPDSPLRNAAREVLGLAQYKAGQLDAAMTTFTAIVDDPLAARDLTGRVQIYIQQLLAEGATAPVVSAPVDVPADASAEPSVAVDPSAELDVSAPASSAEASSSAP
ncbi:MAG: tetratricopeptide repeat protein [Hyphomicrobiales bacterium]|nr:MAG: tetratricopeptide repeat protein [Hyphomicrobiales bacterium]